MKAAQERLERESKESGVLPVEDIQAAEGAVVVAEESAGKTTSEGNAAAASSATPATKERTKVKQSEKTPEAPRFSPGQQDVQQRPGVPRSFGPDSGVRQAEQQKSARSSEKGAAFSDQSVQGRQEEFHLFTPGKPIEEVQEPPWFNEDQLRYLDQMYQQAPWLYEKRPVGLTPQIQRPLFLEQEEQRIQSRSLGATPIQAPMLQQPPGYPGHAFMPPQTGFHHPLPESLEFQRVLSQVVEENRRLQTRVAELEVQGLTVRARDSADQKFATPESEKNAQAGEAKTKDTEERMKMLKQLSGWLTGEAGRQVEGSREEQVDPGRPPLPSREVEGPPRQEAEDPQRQEAEDPQRQEAEDPQRQEAEDPQRQEAEDPRSFEAQGQGSQRSPEESFTAKSLQLMTLMMESMVKMHDKIGDGKEDSGVIKGVEVVKSGGLDLPVLPPWNSQTGPLQLGDWLLLMSPVVADMSVSSQEWWEKMTREAETWYHRHMTLSPMERLTHDAKPPPSVTEPRWQRLERRMAAMMLQAVPEGTREELVAARKIDVFSILTQLLLTYCPGGIQEKQTLLKNLEEPQEVTVVSEAPAAIRRWLRWRTRTTEIGATAPDPTLLVKGLHRLTRKVTESNKELQFRISLVRNSLGIDVAPTDTTALQFAYHLLAEMEQYALTDKRTNKGDPQPKIRSFESDKTEKDKEKGKGKGKDKGGGGYEEERPRCKFFLSDSGCRKGKECTWVHEIKDGQRRCWTCGAIDHMSGSCTRPKGSKEGSPKGKMAKTEVNQEAGSKKKEEGEDEESEKGSSVKDLLEEANKMLKTLSPGNTSSASSTSSTKGEEERKEVLDRLEQQLKSLRTLKVFQLKKMTSSEDLALIDSGATHALRPKRKGENVMEYQEVGVGLASGETVKMRMSPTGCMVSLDYNIQPIVPMGQLTEKLGCEVHWSGGEVKIRHPEKGQLKVEMQEGCPYIKKKVALDLIRELEDFKIGINKAEVGLQEEEEWMRRLVSAHPVLRTLPDHIKDKLVVPIGDWNQVPGNRRRRKKWRREGLVLHLYAGSDEGFTFEKAWVQQQGDPNELLEVDVLRNSQHDMTMDQGIYQGFLRVATEGKFRAILGGPNCRTRSVLRHYPIPDDPNAPRPIRRWNGEEYGIKEATEEEKEKLHEDDLLLWRMIFLHMVNVYNKKARKVGSDSKFLLAQRTTCQKRYRSGINGNGRKYVRSSGSRRRR